MHKKLALIAAAFIAYGLYMIKDCKVVNPKSTEDSVKKAQVIKPHIMTSEEKEKYRLEIKQTSQHLLDSTEVD